MALNTPAQVVADWIELRDEILPLVEEEGLPGGALDTAVALAVIQGSGGGGSGSGASASEIGEAVNGTPITGQTLETGGTQLVGWLASLRLAITSRLGDIDDAAAPLDNSDVGLFSRLKRMSQMLTSIAGGITALVLGTTPTTSENRSTENVAQTSVLVLDANPARTSAIICSLPSNLSPTTIVRGGTAVYGQGIVLLPGGSYEIDSQNMYRGAISAISESGTNVLAIVEGV
jgi:hypothetical protein